LETPKSVRELKAPLSPRFQGVGVGEAASDVSGASAAIVSSIGTIAVATSVRDDSSFFFCSAVLLASAEFLIAASCSAVSSGTGVGVAAAAVFSAGREHPAPTRAPASKSVMAMFFMGEAAVLTADYADCTDDLL